MTEQFIGESIRVRGVVQGVGFRPTVWRLANDAGLTGEVRNDAEGVLITAWGSPVQLQRFVESLQSEAPPLSTVDSIERSPLAGAPSANTFTIVQSASGKTQTGVAADAATCPDCLQEIVTTGDRRFRYPFTNCTHCGPRLSIVKSIPYDRASTSMAEFVQCEACQREYEDPADRRFHAQPNACPQCGPRLWLEDARGPMESLSATGDPIEQAAELIRAGKIVAIKGIGGIHLACDACNSQAVDLLRQRKRRYHKAFAVMVKDLEMARRYAAIDDSEAQWLKHHAAPIVVLPMSGLCLADAVAPGQTTLGIMLPYTPLHHLLMQSLDRPIVLTSGNRSDEPQVIDNQEAKGRLAGIADYWLLHDRDIVNRLDDSVIKLMSGMPRMLRRARGFAPTPIDLPDGFQQAPEILAMGGELKNTFCLLRAGQAVVSQHMGDLENAATHEDYRKNLQLYQQLFDHQPQGIAVDYHPDYLSTQWGRKQAQERGCYLEQVQHHHAHIAGCMADQGLALDTPAVLGVALDGLGMGESGEIWGGEFLKVDYRSYQRLGHLQAMPMPGGVKAMYEPWRNTYAYLRHCFGRSQLAERFAHLELYQYLSNKPLDNLDQMISRGLNCPPATSCGRLFDAVAAALDICRDQASHEGQAAIEMEAIAATALSQAEGAGYPFRIDRKAAPWVIDWYPMWQALLDDLTKSVPVALMAARFHLCVAEAVSAMAGALCQAHGIDRAVLSGGVFQNRILLEAVITRLQGAGLQVMAPTQTPANDGGLSLGQAVVAAARRLAHTG